MTCTACELMNRHEQYARGWVRLYPNDPDAKYVAQYALDLQKLRLKHEEKHHA
jgi:hypothetical protein